MLQGGRALANHPMSYHPQRYVWQPRKKEKVERKRKERETGAESFPKNYCDVDWIPFVTDKGLYMLRKREITKQYETTKLQ